MPQASQKPRITTAASSNRSGTLTVHATPTGLPIAVNFDRGEYAYGAKALAAEILRLTQRSTIAAGAKLRAQREAEGLSAEALDRLGLPTRAQAVEALDAIDDADTGITSWTGRA